MPHYEFETLAKTLQIPVFFEENKDLSTEMPIFIQPEKTSNEVRFGYSMFHHSMDYTV
jgi:hypothetical protein